MKHILRSQQYSASNKDAGYTLTELLVVMVIIALLTGIVAPRLMGRVGKAKSITANTQIENIISAVEIYRLDVGNYPSNELGLRALEVAPEGVSGWDGPYLRQGQIPNDPWGNAYRYKQEGDIFYVFSFGRDNAEGGTGEDADIVKSN